MKISQLFFLVVFPSLMVAQATKKVNASVPNTIYKEVYYVWAADNVTKHGPYKKLYFKNTISEGFYKNGGKDSTWTEYYYDGKTKRAEGTFFQNKPRGVWHYYNLQKELEYSYDFDKKEVVNFLISEKDKNTKTRLIQGGDTLLVNLDRPPLYPGGTGALLEHLMNSTQYPSEAREGGISGKSEVIFTIYDNGKTANHRVKKKLGYGIDEEAVRVVKKLPETWIPAQLNGLPATVEYTLGVNFKIQ